jgi:SAM-dependent methyltransferase
VTKRNSPRLFRDLARWWHLFSAPEDYAEEARYWRRTFVQHSRARPQTVLELGSGGGNSAYHLKRHFEMTLCDLSQGMLDLSATINPECEHVRGDMRHMRLRREFDVVFVHDAINYMTSEKDLKAVMETAFAHVRPGGVALFGPDCTRESFQEGTHCGGHDGPDGRGLRYAVWVSDPDPGDTHFSLDFAYMLREPGGRVRVEQDRHLYCLFRKQQWLTFLRDTGFQARYLVQHHSDAGKLPVFLGRKAGP